MRHLSCVTGKLRARLEVTEIRVHKSNSLESTENIVQRKSMEGTENTVDQNESKSQAVESDR